MRLANSPAASHVTRTEQGLALREMAIGHAERAVAAFLKATAQQSLTPSERMQR